METKLPALTADEVKEAISDGVKSAFDDLYDAIRRGARDAVTANEELGG